MTTNQEWAAHLEVEAEKRNTPPWAHGVKSFDDWGFIRCVATGRLVAIARAGLNSPLSEEDLNEHRRNKTDPYGDVAELICRAVNAHDELVKALDTTTQRLRDVLIYLDQTGCGPQRMQWAKAARADMDAALATLSRKQREGEVKSKTHVLTIRLTFDKPCSAQWAAKEASDVLGASGRKRYASTYYPGTGQPNEPSTMRVRSITKPR